MEEKENQTFGPSEEECNEVKEIINRLLKISSKLKKKNSGWSFSIDTEYGSLKIHPSLRYMLHYS